MATWFENLLENNLEREWDWKNVSCNPNLSVVFIERMLCDPRYKWEISCLVCNRNVINSMSRDISKVLSAVTLAFETTDQLEQELWNLLPRWRWWFKTIRRTSRHSYSYIFWPWQEIYSRIDVAKINILPPEVQAFLRYYDVRRHSHRWEMTWRDVLKLDLTTTKKRTWEIISSNPYLATRKRVDAFSLPWDERMLCNNPGIIKEVLKTDEQWLCSKMPFSGDIFYVVSAVKDGRAFCFRQGLELVKKTIIKARLKVYLLRSI